MATTTAAMRGVLALLQSVATTGNGNVLGIPHSMKHHNVTIKGSAGVAAGAIQVEAADDPTYSGTWASIGGGPVTVVASSELQVTFEGTYQNIRARISTNVTGGTVTVSHVGS